MDARKVTDYHVLVEAATIAGQGYSLWGGTPGALRTRSRPLTLQGRHAMLPRRSETRHNSTTPLHSHHSSLETVSSPRQGPARSPPDFMRAARGIQVELSGSPGPLKV